MRVAQLDDVSYCLVEPVRELYMPGGVSDMFIQSMIRQITSVFPTAMFHLFVNSDETSVGHYRANNVVIHAMTPLSNDLHHFITADIFIMAKSALSKMAAAYRFGPSLMRNEHWNDHYALAGLVVVQDDNLSDKQIANLKRDVMFGRETS